MARIKRRLKSHPNYVFIGELKNLIKKNINRELPSIEIKNYLRENYGYSELYVAFSIYPVLKKNGFYIKGKGAKWVIGLKDGR